MQQKHAPPTRIRRYRLLSLIGSTLNSDVYVAVVPSTNQKIVMKLIPHVKNEDEEIPFPSRMETIERECQIHRRLSHPYIMPVVDTFDYQNFRVILMPRAFGGSLGERKIRDPKSVTKIMYRSLKALQYLHVCNILHGDIKPTNIMIDNITDSDSKSFDSFSKNDFKDHKNDSKCEFSRNDSKSDTKNDQQKYCEEPVPLFIDFGHARELSNKHFCHCHNMTCSFSSPELLALKPHSFPSDIWSLAATFIFMITGREILRLKNIEIMAKEALNLKLTFNEREYSNYPSSLQDLLQSMLNRAPEKRPNVHKCLAHEFFEEMLGAGWIRRENDRVPPIPAKERLC
ncbi:hypothetical protein TRFO_05545 [Tritrichomonas foetus]|uniref:Protein kinase domain-containing protein n=1 Tax=Tritrichomonas foetus TaxID=1144522 RepID=A0A1J4K4I8_9EUKA|nr:hypothetical protein TRFO_05545 [Tritrichomonas foetus]|eukprot:OHT06361.1 hypothetical protein TRFO_05545 [Tritrichomonas foetus]